MKKILIIDDEERIRDIYMRMFGSENIIVRRAANAVEATNILIREEIDLILLDIGMPHIGGRTMFEIIEEHRSNCKVIVSSVYPIPKQKSLIPDADDYFDKAEGPLKLMEKVLGVLGEKAGNAV